MPKSNKPLYRVGCGRPFVNKNKRGMVAVAAKTRTLLRKMATDAGLPSGLIVHAALLNFQRLPAQVRTVKALGLVGWPG